MVCAQVIDTGLEFDSNDASRHPSLRPTAPLRYSDFESSEDGSTDHAHGIFDTVQLVFKTRIGGIQDILTVLHVRSDQQGWETVIQHALGIRGPIPPDIARLVLRHGARAVDRRASLTETLAACSDAFLQVDIAQEGGMQTYCD